MRLGFTTAIFEKEFQEQLIELEDIILFALENGFEAIELREGCVGDHDERALPEFASRYREIYFTYAIKNDCLAEKDNEKVKTAIEVSASLSNNPVLRLLANGGIIKNQNRRYSIEEKDRIANVLKYYATIASEKKVALAVENAREPMEDIKYIIEKVSSPLVGYTFDPGNLSSIAIEREDPLEALAKLESSHIKLVHLKQTLNGEPQSNLCPGDIDIKKLLTSLHMIGYEGVVCLELKPGKECRQRLKSSIEFMNGLFGKKWPYF